MRLKLCLKAERRLPLPRRRRVNRIQTPPISALTAALLVGFFGAWILSWHPFSPPEAPSNPQIFT